MANTPIPSDNLASVAEGLVRRARNGDQNAMAMIAEVRTAATRGSKKAQQSYLALEKYIHSNPAATSDMGVDEPKKIPKRSIALANGPNLTQSRLAEIGSFFGGEEEQALYYDGVENYKNLPKPTSPDMLKILKASWETGVAKALQLVRLPHTKITPFSPMAGWEMGE